MSAPGTAAPGTQAIGQASDDVNATAAGVLLAASSGLLAGAASGSATAAGVLLQSAFSVVPGHASASAQTDGATLSAAVALLAGAASGQQRPVRASRGGVQLVRRRRGDAVARGALLRVGVSLAPGEAQIGHEITVREADGSICTHVFFGLSDEELADDDLMLTLIEGDFDTWLLSA
ncbi:hypothetical protein [Bradyrhizobium sp. Pha-3]|uniref:hypothetical protein n=1 Tax=Bradyrhizobium TaxID=374 RepID=UPI0035D492BC